MSRYGKIENDEVVWTGECPKSTKRVSNFYLLPDSEKAEWGYYTIIDDDTELKDWESVTNRTHTLDVDSIQETKILESKSLADYKTYKIANAKRYAHTLFESKYNTLDMLSDDTQTEAKTYANNIKGKFITYRDLVNSKTTLLQVFGVPLQ